MIHNWSDLRAFMKYVYNVFMLFCCKKKSDKFHFVETCRLLERITGIEPASSAWEADVLPMNYIRKIRRANTAKRFQ